MLRLIAVAFALTVASSAQALPPVVSLNQPDTLVTPVREACGAGMHMVNGVCVRTPTRRAASRRPRSDLLSHGNRLAGAVGYARRSARTRRSTACLSDQLRLIHRSSS